VDSRLKLHFRYPQTFGVQCTISNVWYTVLKKKGSTSNFLKMLRTFDGVHIKISKGASNVQSGFILKKNKIITIIICSSIGQYVFLKRLLTQHHYGNSKF
jgi:ABC-type ATPase with predicted acetyltransferase domain